MLAAVTVMTLVSLIVFFAVGEPWGSLNDAGNALMALLCGALAALLHRVTSVVATSLAVLGAAISVLGSYLVMTDTTGYFLAGLVSAAGFALIGSWLVVLGRVGAVPASLIAQVAGMAMATGLVNIPGILQGFDDLESVPWWILAAKSAGPVPTCCCRCGRFAPHVPLWTGHQPPGLQTATDQPFDQPIARDLAGGDLRALTRAL